MSATVPERVRARITRIESEAGLEESRPTFLRTSGFVFLVIGAALVGVGAVSPWITVGIPDESAHSSIIGTDLADGRVALACAVVVLTAMLIGRLVRSTRMRYMLASVNGCAAVVSLLVGGLFIREGKDRSAVLATIGIPRHLWALFGVFRDLDAGSYLVLAGGVSCVAGVLLTFRWLRTDRPVAAEDSRGTASG